MSKKKLCPWITLNGEDTADSQFVILRLKEHFNLPEDDLTDERRAALDCARIMLEEQTFW